MIAGFVLVTMLALALAAKPAESDNGTDATGTAKEAKNMTYGQCVSEGAKIKNDCYGSVKSAYSS